MKSDSYKEKEIAKEIKNENEEGKISMKDQIDVGLIGPKLYNTKTVNTQITSIKIQDLPKAEKEKQKLKQQQKYYSPEIKNSIEKFLSPSKYQKVFKNIEATKGQSLIQGVSKNAFFDMFYLAYSLHGEITLSPDDVWLTILIPIANYINTHTDEMRSLLVNFDNKMELEFAWCVNKPDGSQWTFKDLLGNEFD